MSCRRRHSTFSLWFVPFISVYKVGNPKAYEANSFYTDRHLTSAFCRKAEILLFFHFPEILCEFLIFHYIHAKDMKREEQKRSVFF